MWSPASRFCDVSALLLRSVIKNKLKYASQGYVLSFRKCVFMSKAHREYPLNVVDREAFCERASDGTGGGFERLCYLYIVYVGYVLRFLIEEQMIEPTVLEEAEQIAILKNENALTPTALAERFNHCVPSVLIKPSYQKAAYRHLYYDYSIEEGFFDLFKDSIDLTIPVDRFDSWDLFNDFSADANYIFSFADDYPLPPSKGKMPLWAIIGIAITCISILLVCAGSYAMNNINNYYHPSKAINTILHALDENVYIKTPWSPESPTYEAFDDPDLIAQLEASISDSAFMKQVKTVPINPAIAAYFFEKTENHNWDYFHGRKEFDRWQAWAKQATLIQQKNFV